jgi:HD-like signal output (HDOD) protein
MPDETLDALVVEAASLPASGSGTLPRVLAECDSADASVTALARLMADDRRLAEAVIDLAHAAHPDAGWAIGSLPQALELLGFDTIRTLAMAAGVLSACSAAGASALAGEARATAVACRAVGYRRLVVEHAFLAGLFGRAGEMVVACLRPPAGAAPGLGALPELGARAAAEWGLPAAVCRAIHDQRTPLGSPEGSRLACALHVGIAVAARLDTPGDRWPEVDEAALQALGLEASDLGSFAANVAGELADGAKPVLEAA